MASRLALEGRRAVVTGASRGIGRAIAVAFAEAGASVASLSLPSPSHGEEVVAEVEQAGGRALFVEGNVGEPAHVQGLADRVVDEWGGIDIWVNNAGRLLVRPIVELEDDDWHNLLATNLHGYFYGCRAAARHMAARGTGCIVNITSVTDVQAVAGLGAYVTAKGGIVGMTRVLALELAGVGVRVNAIAPGATETPLNAEAWDDDVRRAYRARIALGRIADTAEIADVAVFLASDAARYITGQEIVVDGGLAINGTVGHRT